jgi:hypothetical protein
MTNHAIFQLEAKGGEVDVHIAAAERPRCCVSLSLVQIPLK